MHSPTLFDHALAVLLGVLLPLCTALAQRPAPVERTLNAANRVATYWANGAALWVLAGLVVGCWLLAGRTLIALGLAAPAVDALPMGALLGGAVVAFYALDLWLKVGTPERLARTRERWRRDLAIMPENRAELRHFAFVAWSAGVCEEIAFRGHLVPYVRSFTGPSLFGSALAVMLPALPFAAVHLYQGAREASKTIVLAVLFGILLLATGSLWIPIGLHVSIDLASAVVGLRYGRAADAGADGCDGGTPPVAA